MAFEWKNYLGVASHLISCEQEELCKDALMRSAASRAYYAAYGEAWNYAIKHYGDHKNEKPEDHILLRDIYKRNKRIDVAMFLDELRGWRNKCDYEDDVSNAEKLATSALQRAKNLLAKLKITG